MINRIKYTILEHQNKEAYDVDMYRIYIRDKKSLRYMYKLNREEYIEFLLDKKISEVELFTSIGTYDV